MCTANIIWISKYYIVEHGLQLAEAVFKPAYLNRNFQQLFKTIWILLSKLSFNSYSKPSSHNRQDVDETVTLLLKGFFTMLNNLFLSYIVLYSVIFDSEYIFSRLKVG